MYVQGIDVSHWQNNRATPQMMNFTKAYNQGARYVFIKVSERSSIDRDFNYHWQASKAAGLLRGGYHFLRWDLSGLVQARIFCDALKDDPGELPPVADFEAPAQGDRYPSNALLEQFLIEVENRLGKRPIIYTSPGYWNEHGRDRITRRIDPKWSYYTLWIAHWFRTYQEGVTKPMEIEPWKSAGKTWTFWQYTSTGDGLAFGAESKGIDLNWFNGTMAQLRAFAGAGTTPAPTPTPTPDPAPAKPSAAQIADLKNRISSAIDGWTKTL
jgi:lysozyme